MKSKKIYGIFLILMFWILVFLLYQFPDNTETNNKELQSAIELFKLQRFEAAADILSSHNNYRSVVVRAISFYKNNDITRACVLFKNSIYLADTDQQRYLSLFNYAACVFQLGYYEESSLFFTDATKYHPDSIKAQQYGKLAKDLSTFVAQQSNLNQKPKSKRSGSGKVLLSLDETKFDREAGIRLEDSQDEIDNKVSVNRIIANLDPDVMEIVIDKGLAAIKLTEKTSVLNNLKFESASNNQQYTHLVEHTPKELNYKLWSRLFEQEFGIPAASDEKIIIDGVNPW